jgi:hypothetical protein
MNESEDDPDEERPEGDGAELEETDIDSDEQLDGEVDAGGAAAISRRNE